MKNKAGLLSLVDKEMFSSDVSVRMTESVLSQKILVKARRYKKKEVLLYS